MPRLSKDLVSKNLLTYMFTKVIDLKAKDKQHIKEVECKNIWDWLSFGQFEIMTTAFTHLPPLQPTKELIENAESIRNDLKRIYPKKKVFKNIFDKVKRQPIEFISYQIKNMQKEYYPDAAKLKKSRIAQLIEWNTAANEIILGDLPETKDDQQQSIRALQQDAREIEKNRSIRISKLKTEIKQLQQRKVKLTKTKDDATQDRVIKRENNKKMSNLKTLTKTRKMLAEINKNIETASLEQNLAK